MLKLSKNKEKFSVNEKEYRVTKWSTITTLLEGKKLLLAIAPALSTIADMKLDKSLREPSLEELVEGTDIEFLLTGAFTQLSANFSDELFEGLVTKLLSGIEYRVREEDGEFGDWKEPSDWSEHFDDHTEDFELVIMKSAKVNLYDFFMKQATVRSSIEKVMTVASPLVKQLGSGLKEGSS